MAYPVLAKDGICYDRRSIQDHLKKGNLTSPLTGKQLNSIQVTPVRALRSAIEEWEERVFVNLPRAALHLESPRAPELRARQGKLHVSGGACDLSIMVLEVPKEHVQTAPGTLIRLGRHPNLARFLGFSSEDSKVLLVTERGEHGPLMQALDHLTKHNPGALTGAHRVAILREICLAMTFLQTGNYANDCLNQQNLYLFNFDAGDPEATVVKAAGYGILLPVSDNRKKDRLLLGTDTSKRYDSDRLYWESMSRDFGILAWHIMSRGLTTSHSSPNEFLSEASINPKVGLKRPLGCPVTIWSCIQRCLEGSPSLRPTFRELLSTLHSVTFEDETGSIIARHLRIELKSLTGRSSYLQVKGDQTVRSIKEMYEDEEGPSVNSQRLIYNGRQLDDSSTLDDCNVHDGDVLHVVLRLHCIAAAVPASFGKHRYTPHSDYLTSDVHTTAVTSDLVSSIINDTGGSLHVRPIILTESVLTQSACKALVNYIDRKAGEDLCNLDLRFELKRDCLKSIIGDVSLEKLETLLAAPYDRIRVRRVIASDNWVPFHTDQSRRTMQVALNSENDYDGGRLIFVTEIGFVQPSRSAGWSTIHMSSQAHGVTKLRSGVRYGLFLCDIHGHFERKLISYLVPSVLAQFEFFREAVRVLQEIDNDTLTSYVQQYAHFQSSSTRVEVPCFEVELVWRTHLLSPTVYKKACERMFPSGSSEGNISTVDHCPRPSTSYTHGRQERRDAVCTGWLGIDLVATIRQQQEFMGRILASSQDLRSSEAVRKCLEDYYVFLRSIGDRKEQSVPSLMVDLVWHTHLLFPRRYHEECHIIAGCFVNHEATQAKTRDVDAGSGIYG